MCHSRERWTFWSRQQHKTEALNRSDEAPKQTDAAVQDVDSSTNPRKAEPSRREKDLERVS